MIYICGLLEVMILGCFWIIFDGLDNLGLLDRGYVWYDWWLMMLCLFVLYFVVCFMMLC